MIVFYFALLAMSGYCRVTAFVTEGVELAMCYGYVVDNDSPNYLGRGDKVFQIDRNDLSISSNQLMDMHSEYSTSDHTASQKIASEFAVSGSYGAFSAAASMSVNKYSSSNIKTVRLDAVVKATKYTLSSKGTFRTFPERFLTDNFKEAVRKLSLPDIEDRIGVFYATKMQLGGCVKKTYIMEATEDDTRTSVKAELEASYGKGSFGVTGSASGGTTVRTSNKNAKMRTEWKAQGGKTEIWLGINFKDSDKSASNIARKWAATISSDNVYPTEFDLVPMWELVKAVDPKKGADFQKYLENKWKQDASMFNPTQFLKSKPLISKHASASWIIARCKKHRDWCRDQAAAAQSWMDTWHAQFDRTRNYNWKNAAESGRNEMNVIISKVEDPKLTVEDFKENMELRAKNRDINSKHYWGLGGRDSEQSNKVEREHRNCINEIIRKL